MEQSDPELPRLRRFALFVGLTLWAYVLAGGSVGKMLQVPALGLTLTFTRTHVLEWGLVLICIYATARYGYHSLEESKGSGVFFILHQRNVVALYLT